LNPQEQEILYEIVEILKSNHSIYVDDLIRTLKRASKELSSKVSEETILYYLMKLELLGEVVVTRTTKKGMIVKYLKE
jgi:DNA-binding PadR family transcriptional regulator